MTTPLLKVLAIVGSTASGKSAWAVRLAKHFNGVVLSADSRQVYKGLDVITAKITRQEMDGIPHELLDVARMDEDFNVTKYQKMAYAILDRVEKNNRKVQSPVLPIIAGGTGLYVAAVCDGYEFVDIKPNLKLRVELGELTLPELQKRLIQLDSSANVDMANPRRLIRAIEILESGVSLNPKQKSRFEVLKIGIKKDIAQIEKDIEKRVRQIDIPALLEEARLIASSPKTKANPLAIYYQPTADFLDGKIDKKELLTRMVKGDRDYAKRQLTWFKKDESIHWVGTFAEAKKLTRRWLNY